MPHRQTSVNSYRAFFSFFCRTITKISHVNGVLKNSRTCSQLKQATHWCAMTVDNVGSCDTRCAASFSVSTHYPCSRAVNTGVILNIRVHGTRWWQKVLSHFASTAREHGCSVHSTRVHGPSTRPVCSRLVKRYRRIRVNAAAEHACPNPKRRTCWTPVYTAREHGSVY